MKKEINNLKALIRMKISPSNNLNIIIHELEDVISSNKVKPVNKSNMLKVMHLLRALETTLKKYLDEKSIPYSPRHGMGQIFHKYNEHTYYSLMSNISNHELTRYKSNLYDKRNEFMHNAGIYPNNQQIQDLLQEIDICLNRILNL